MTTTSAPAAAAIPAVRSSAPSAIFDFFSSGWPGNANSGACTESAMSCGPRQLAEPLGPRVVDPEAALEIELAGGVAALEEQLDREVGRLPRRDSGQGRRGSLPSSRPYRTTCNVVRWGSYPFRHGKAPTRIDLLELDIDLRLADLWREAGEVSEWNLEVVAAFMRAAYGKGYCDALTEDDPGSLCHDHGYRIPARRETAPRSV